MIQRPSRDHSHLSRRMGEHGQAALAMVLGIVMLLVTGGTLLASNTVQHDPLVQADVVTHYAYRALESGINSYLTSINADPMLVTCSTAASRPTCVNSATAANYYDAWTQVPDTTTSAGSVPEWYLWTNPQLCFSTSPVHDTACTSKPTTGNFEYLQVLIIGAAGNPGQYQYQSSVANFEPTNSFLTHLWWSNYESAPNPAKAKTAHVSTQICKYNWANGHGGPGPTCTSVNFGSTTHVNGPVFSNDSIYTYGTPTFGTPSTSTARATVSSGDPTCLFVTNTGSCRSSAGVKYTAANSHIDVPYEKPPATDTQLETVAFQDGCVYTGPTTISFYTTKSASPGHHQGYMLVTSPETKATSTGRRIAAATRGSSNTTICLSRTATHKPIPAPSGTHGNGVVYVKTGSSCTSPDNPFEGKRSGQNSATAQIVVGSYNYTNDSVTGTSENCEGDAFVRDTDKGSNGNTPSGYVRGIAGNLTVAAENNIVITGTLTYADCSTTWNSKSTCPYHPGAVNDSLGLIATNFVEVNRPVKPTSGCPNGRLATCPKTDGTGQVTISYGWFFNQTYTWTPETTCGATITDVQAVLCNPGPNLTIDAALLDLKHSFVVNNFQAKNYTHTLTIFGAIDQYWRGEVGVLGGYASRGYNKWYTWDSRLQYLSIPSFLTPGTPSWTLASSSVVTTSTCPGWLEPYGTSGLIPSSTTKDPSGVSGACSGVLPT